MKRTLYLLQYMPGVVAVLGQAGFHIMGQAQNDIGVSMDGIAAKSPYTGTVNQVDGVVQGSTDAMEEVKVLTTGVSAEYGHTAGGSMKMIYKSGTNQLHVSFEDRYLPGNWSHRAYLTQNPNPPQAPWFYETFDLVVSGPLVIPKIYDGRNKTFWLSDYAINHEHTINYNLNTVPTPEMLNGDFSFKDANGGGLPIYDPASTRQVGSTFVRDQFAGNIIPKSRFDPIAAQFLQLGIWNAPTLPGTPSRTGPSNNLLAVNSCRCLHRDRWDEKIDHQFSSSEKIFGRYSLRWKGDPIHDLTPPSTVTASAQAQEMELLRSLNKRFSEDHLSNPDLQGRIDSYELAYRMQAEVPGTLDIAAESEETRQMYGLNDPVTESFGKRCLMARKLVEKGVRFVQLYTPSQSWDGHTGITANHEKNAKETDQPIAALIRDLKQRGLFDSTLLVWMGEFGRTPDNPADLRSNAGRDHNTRAMTMWFAGAGIKRGTVNRRDR